MSGYFSKLQTLYGKKDEKRSFVIDKENSWRMILLFPLLRWASLRLVTETSSLSPTLAAVWHLAASLSGSSSMECPSPFCSTSSLTTTPNWRNRSTHFQTLSAPSSFRSVCGANLTAALNLRQKNPMMRSTFDPVEDILTLTLTLSNRRRCLTAGSGGFRTICTEHWAMWAEWWWMLNYYASALVCSVSVLLVTNHSSDRWTEMFLVCLLSATKDSSNLQPMLTKLKCMSRISKYNIIEIFYSTALYLWVLHFYKCKKNKK